RSGQVPCVASLAVVTHVEPVARVLALVAGPEAGVLHEPGGGGGWVDIGEGGDGEARLLPVVTPVVDGRLLTPHDRGDVGEFDDVDLLGGVGDLGLIAAGASGGHGTFLVHIATRGAAPPGAHVALATAQIHGVDLDRVAAGVERGSGGEVA